MFEARVTQFKANGKPAKQLDVRLRGDNPNFDLKFEKLEQYFLRRASPRQFDFLDIASTVFAADCQFTRGGAVRADFGQNWRRNLKFKIPVRDPEFWSQAAVRAALTDAVEFLCEDTVSFEFTKNEEEIFRQVSLFSLVPEAEPEADCVVLFSGGLDSLAGTIELLTNTSKRLFLVTHFSATKRLKYPEHLAEILRERFPGRVIWLPVTARLHGLQAKESTQRSRSLLFSALGVVGAGYTRAKDIHFFENGIVSSNLPISSQVVGTMASRTTHPRSIKLLAQLLHLVAPGEGALTNPYLWKTKAEVIETLNKAGSADLIKWSVSCSHVIQQTLMQPHCSACSQCMDRRFGVLAAGLAGEEDADMYEADVLTGERLTDRSRLLALDWVKHGLSMAALSNGEFFARFGPHLSRLVEGIDDRPSWKAFQDLIELHRRQGTAVAAVLEHAISANSSRILDASLPETSLLRGIVAQKNALPTLAVDLRKPETALEPSLDTEGSIFPLQVSVSGSGANSLLTVKNLGEVAGINATPVPVLIPRLLQDQALKRDPLDFKYTPGATMAELLVTSKENARQRIKRLREDLAQFYEALEGEQPAEPILIQSAARAYRIDPEAEVINWDGSEH